MKTKTQTHTAVYPSTAAILATSAYCGMTYADIATGPKDVVRYYSCGTASRVYFYDGDYVRSAILRAEGESK